MRQRFAILGAGIVGLLSARLLLQRGADVLLVDRQQPARGASWAGGGIVSPLYPWKYPAAVSALADGAQDAHARLAADLRAETGVDPEYNRCGMLMLDPADADLAREWCRRHDRRLVSYDRAGLASLQPGLGAAAERGFWLPEIGNVRNPRLLRALLASVVSHPHAQVAWHAEVSLDAADGGAHLRVNGLTVACDGIVVAAGAWTRALLRPFGIELAIEPVRGQMLLYPPQPGLLRSIVLHDGRYLIPRRDGRILAGSTLEFSGFNAATTAAGRTQLQQAAIAMLPALAGVVPEMQWAGLRPGAPGGIPYIDCVPGTRVLVNAGHFRNGLVLAPAAAATGVALLLGERPPVAAAPYALGAPRGDQLV